MAKLDKAGALDASGNNPDVKHDDMVQAIHDAAAHLGAQCMNAADADPGTADGANKNAETSTSKEVGSSQESPDESPAEVATKAAAIAPAEVPAEAAEPSADDAARQKAKALELGRGTAFLIKMNTQRINDA
jgi:hypothetical protein